MRLFFYSLAILTFQTLAVAQAEAAYNCWDTAGAKLNFEVISSTQVIVTAPHIGLDHRLCGRYDSALPGYTLDLVAGRCIGTYTTTFNLNTSTKAGSYLVQDSDGNTIVRDNFTCN
jgi:hypothetical protein